MSGWSSPRVATAAGQGVFVEFSRGSVIAESMQVSGEVAEPGSG